MWEYRMTKTRKIFIGFAAIIVVALSAVVVYLAIEKYANSAQKTSNNSSSTILKTKSIKNQKSNSSEELPSSSSSDEEELSSDDEHRLEALATLEKSDEPADNQYVQEVREAFSTAENAVKQCQVSDIIDFKGTIDNKLSMTYQDMAQTYAIAVIVNNYSLDTVEVYNSKNPDVVQFVVGLKSEGKEENYWAGNYNIYAKQIRLISYHGGELGATYG